MHWPAPASQVWVALVIVLRVREPVPGAEDEFGNATFGWEEHDWPVRAIAPGSMEEQDRTVRDLSVVMWTVYADKGLEPSEAGQVRLPGSPAWYTVEGRPKDWTLGPERVGPAATFTGPGVVVELRRADG